MGDRAKKALRERLRRSKVEVSYAAFRVVLCVWKPRGAHCWARLIGNSGHVDLRKDSLLPVKGHSHQEALARPD